MFMAYFFIVVYILMSGLLTSVEKMPGCVQNVIKENLITYLGTVQGARLRKKEVLKILRCRFWWALFK
jgi:hypothetical protein